ncbi:MAG TPA: haloacid dehalogenase-like hydrolase [Polyangiales bacterium]
MAYVSNAVFDFDGTLIHGDSTTRWLLDVFKRSPVRLLLAISVLPAALPMTILPATRRRGASVFLWLATFGLDESAVESSLRAFARRFEAGELPIHFRRGAIETLERHLADGHRVAICTAAPALVARALLGRWLTRVAVVGSPLRKLAGGFIFERHCYAWEKCTFLREAGYPESWQFAYTDSIADRALLVNADQGYVINPGRMLRRKVSQERIAEALVW